MPEEFIELGEPVKSYRAYYAQAKAHLLSYRFREAPSWLNSFGGGKQTNADSVRLNSKKEI